MKHVKKLTTIIMPIAGAISAVLFLAWGLKAEAGQKIAPLELAEQSITDNNTHTLHLPFVGLNAGAPPPLFGVQMYGTSGLDKIADAGARWIRLPISWESVEPTDRMPDQYNWASIDATVQSLTNEGIEPLLTLGGNPDWAAIYPMGPVTDLADLQQFMGALVERFDGDGYEDAPGSPVVRYWEIYNEPDATRESAADHGGYGFFGHRGSEYAKLLDAIYPVVKEASPRSQVVFGGVAHDNFDDEGGGFDRYFVDEVLANCTTKGFDVMNFHYYPYYRSRWEAYGTDVIGKANYFRSKLADYGFDRPLMCTETTWPRASMWGSDDLQVRYVVAANVRGVAAGFLTQNWYAWRDVDSSLPGLLDNDLQPKPAYYAYQTLADQLGKASYKRPLTKDETNSDNIEGYVFTVPGKSVKSRLDVIWYDCPGYKYTPPEDCSPGVSQTMEVQASALQVTDLYGNSNIQYDLDDGIADGKVTLEIGPDPVYVKYDPPSSESTSYANSISRSYSAETYEQEAPRKGNEDSYSNCRFGVGVSGNVVQYNVADLNTGWYVDWGTSQSPETPAGMEYVQMIRLEQVGTADWAMRSPVFSQFTDTVQSNPSALWLIGNEPDSPFQDDMLPEAYAHAYHDVYKLIKNLDPTAQVSIGGIVQPTPLRFDYLDTVWTAYLQAYGKTMPVDVWNIHTFILRETAEGHAPDPEPCKPVTKTISIWGGFTPPGSTSQSGKLYCVRDQDDIDIFKQRIRKFRQWMADKGERDKPLIVTEYGVLFPEDYTDEDDIPFSQKRVQSFMYDTFDFFLNATDPDTGYPYDGNRLVQRWAWFSLDSDPQKLGGALFDPDTREKRKLGEALQSYTENLTPTVDLAAARAFAVPSTFWHEHAPVTATLKAVVSNIGNVSTTSPITVTFYDGAPYESNSDSIGSAQVLTTALCGCADYKVVETDWKGLMTGTHKFYVTVESSEDDEVGNNIAEGTVLVASHRAFLPVVFSH